MSFNFIVVPFLNLLLYIYQLLGSSPHAFGWAIIIFTVIIRLATYPLNKQQIESAKKMQDLQASEKYKKIQKKYKNDREKLGQEQMKLYQEMGINPFGSCLPTLIQFPIILGLYWSVTRALATSPLQLLNLAGDLFLRNASALIPLNSQFYWMDLSQPERWLGLTDIIPSSFPLIGEGIPILAILVFFTSFVQSKLMTPTTTSEGQGAAMNSMLMSIYLPVLMAWLSYAYAAGLALYFVTSNIATMVQYAIMGRFDFSNVFGSKS